MKKNPYKGKFIAFEGLDGSGQTTQAALLKKYLENQGLGVVLTKEPTWDNEAGKWINETLRQNKKLNLDELKVLQKKFAEDRDWHQKNRVIPALKQEKIVITDRSQFSSFAFGVASGVDLDYLLSLNQNFIEPDLIILLKVSPKVCIARIQKRGEKEALFEKEEQLKRVWGVYERLAKEFKNIIIVDGEGSIEEIRENIKKIINQKLGVKT